VRLFSAVAQLDQVGETLSQVFGYVLGLMLRNVDANLPHRFDSGWAEFFRRPAGAYRFKVVARHLAEKTLSHLRPAGIPGAKKQDLLFNHVYLLLTSP
jgi:hypothetical protein